MLPHNGCDRPGKRDVFQNVVPRLSVGLYEHEFNVREFAGFCQDLGRNLDFAQIVDTGRKAEAVDFVVRQTQFLRDRSGQFPYAPLMAGGVGVAHFHGIGDRLNGLLKTLSQYLLVVLVFVRNAIAVRLCT